MNIRDFWNALLAAAGSTERAVNETDFRVKYVKALNVVGPATSGTTANRPVGVDVGFQYFDTTVGEPVWWDGSVWVGFPSPN